MNNVVEIIYGKGERYPQISINGEKISRYMELADLIHDDIFNWADKLFESMDDELCENYTVNLTGHPFHATVLRSMQTRSQYCTEISFAPIIHKISMADKLSYAKEVNERYSLGILRGEESIRFFSDEPERFSKIVPCCDEPCSYFITAGTQLPAQKIKYCIMISEQLHFEKSHGVSVLHIPMHLLNETVDYLNTYHLHLGLISGVFSAIRDLTLSEDEQLKYEAYLNEEYRIKVGELPLIMNTGERFHLIYTYYPAQFDDPQITVGTVNPDVVFVADNTLIAQSAGSATIVLTDKLGTSHGSYTVNVEHHNYVTDISVILPATSISVNEMLHFKCLISPNDAEDAHTLRYTINDTSVAAFSGQNEIYGIAPGRVKVTVSTARISKNFYLTVLPTAREVLLPMEVLKLPNNSDAEIECTVFPANATPMPCASWQSSNPSVVKVVSSNGFSCKVTSLKPGAATLQCSLVGTDISNTMRIEVANDQGCYIATAVYGSYDCPPVWILRRYRDHYLAEHSFGRAFIKAYYALSPTAVKLFGKTRWFNSLWRRVLDRKIEKLKLCGYEDTPYND